MERVLEKLILKVHQHEGTVNESRGRNIGHCGSWLS
jgi:hypothetical protein